MIEELTKITNCPACGTEVVEGAVFCHKCGANLREWKAPLPTPQPVNVCEYCGALLEEGAGFCVNCGKPVGGKKAPKNENLSGVQMRGRTGSDFFALNVEQN